jgi:hypothetical protein
MTMLATKKLVKTLCKRCEHFRKSSASFNPNHPSFSWYDSASCNKKYEERIDLEHNQKWRDAEALVYEIMPWDNRKYNKEFKVPHGCPFILEVILKEDENAS